MILLYDSDDPDSIPSGVWAAGYVSGYAAAAWISRGFQRFIDARRINVFAFVDDGDTFDCEKGDITPEQMPGCVIRAHARGIAVPWAYCDRDQQHAVEDAMWAAGIQLHQVAMWIATLDGTTSVPRYRYPIAAVQYLNPAHGSGGHYDLSLVDVAYGASSGQPEGELDMATAAQILAAVTMPPPKKPDRFKDQTDQQLLDSIVDASTWAQIEQIYTTDEVAYLYAISHPVGVGQAMANLAQATGFELAQLQGDIAAVKAEEDELKRALIQAPSQPVGQDVTPTPPTLTS